MTNDKKFKSQNSNLKMQNDNVKFKMKLKNNFAKITKGIDSLPLILYNGLTNF